MTIRWTIVDTDMGSILVAATERGVCRVAFGQGEEDLTARFPGAVVARDDGVLGALAQRVGSAVARPQDVHNLPLDVGGTPFQQAVWAALARVPPGESLSYADLAAAAGQSGAARAAGAACGANPVAVLIPCHRARRGDGSAGGYAWGLERKAELLRREGGTLL